MSPRFRPVYRSLPWFAFYFLQASAALSFSPSDADRSLDSFNSAFYRESGGYGYFKDGLDSEKPADFWKWAEEIEMVCDAYERSGNAHTREQIVNLMEGFNHHYGKEWTDSNKYNDDIMWICIAGLRAAQITGKAKFASQARENFDKCYARAWDTAFAGGGLWWTTDKACKNACVNGPAAIAAFLLYKAYGEKTYLEKAKAVLKWEKKVLTNGSGEVYDNITVKGVVDKTPRTYNEGTY